MSYPSDNVEIVKQWRPISERRWRVGEPPSSAEMYEVRELVILDVGDDLPDPDEED